MKMIQACVLVGVAVMSVFAEESAEINVRSAGRARTWQVNLSPDEPISWPWGAADAATLVVSGAVEKTAWTYHVARHGDEPFGACAIELPEDRATCEHLLFLSLTLSAEGSETDRMEARVAYLPTAFTVEDAAGKEWRKLVRPHVFAFDTAWTDGGAETVDLTFAVDGRTGMVPLAGVAGYDVIDPVNALGRGFGGPFHAVLSFDGEEAFAADLQYGRRGTILMFK